MGTVLKPRCAVCGEPTLNPPHARGLHFCSAECLASVQPEKQSEHAALLENYGAQIDKLLKDDTK